MESTKDSKNPTKTTKTTPTKEVEAVENIDKDATVVTGQAGDEPVTVVMNPPKKHKVGIIVSIVAFLLVLIGGVSFATWYFCIHNSPDVIAYDAMRQLISAEHVSASGTVRIASSEPDEDGHRTVADITFTSFSMHLPSKLFITLDISERDRDDKVVDNHQIGLRLNATAMTDGTLYFQVDDLTESVDQFLDSNNSDLEDQDDAVQFAYALAELIEGEWWQISVADIMDELNFGSAISDPVTEFYDCVLSASQEHADLAKLYDAYRFVSIEKDGQATTSGATRYKVALSYDELAGFVNALPETAGGEKVIVCYNDLADAFDLDPISAKDFPETSAKELKEAFPSDYQLHLEISDFGHQLRRVDVTSTMGDVKIDGFLDFNYSAIEVTTPSDYRPITDLFEDAFELFGEYFYGISGTDPIDPDYGQYPYINQGSGVIFI